MQLLFDSAADEALSEYSPSSYRALQQYVDSSNANMTSAE